MAANERQEGGSHYRDAAGATGEQHWDRIWRMYGRGYFVGCATKYLERYHLKNGVEDLKKSIHFTEKLIELETAHKERTDVQHNTVEQPCNHDYEAFYGPNAVVELCIKCFQPREKQ